MTFSRGAQAFFDAGPRFDNAPLVDVDAGWQFLSYNEREPLTGGYREADETCIGAASGKGRETGESTG